MKLITKNMKKSTDKISVLRIASFFLVFMASFTVSPYVFAQTNFLGPITEYSNKQVIESPGQLDSSSCPDGSVLVGFNLDNIGSNYSHNGSLYCQTASINLGYATEYSGKNLAEEHDANPFISSTCPDGSVLIGFNLDNMGSNYSHNGSLYCQTTSVDLGSVKEYSNKHVIESPGQLDSSSCPDGSVLVGFNLYNIGKNYSATGSLYCRQIIITQAQYNPTVSIHANPSNINYNGSSTISWNSENATACYGSGGANGWYGNKNLSGTFYTDSLTTTTTFSISCNNSGYGSASDSATVNVGNQNYQPTVSITADDENIDFEDSTTLRWFSNNANYCYASNGTNGWYGNKDTSGTFYTGALRNTTTYTITCSNNINSSSDSVTIRVDKNNNNDDDVRVDISADDTSIDFEDSTRIRWDSDNADYCTSSDGTNDWENEDIDTSGSFNTGPLRNDETFRITCYNNSDSASDSVTVRVDEDNNDNEEGPDVTTRNATSVSTTSATLNGRVAGNGSSVRVWFEYGTNSNLGYSTSENSYSSTSRNFDRNISGLLPNTTYYFRAVAENSQDITYGNTLSFRTINNFDNFEVSPQPTVVLSSDSTNIAYNGATFLRWYTTDATTCYASGGSVGWAGVKNIGSGSFYTGSLTGNRTYSINCSNNVGSTADSATINVRGQVLGATIVKNPPKPALTSLVLITSSLDRNQPVIPTLDNTRPHPGDEINYNLSYQNIGTGAITDATLRIDLPLEVDYIFSTPTNPIKSGNTLFFSLGKLGANAQGTVTVRVRLQNNVLPGTNLNFPATLSYIDPSGSPQSVIVNVSAQVWSEPVPPKTNLNASLGANALSAGFLPTNLFGWLLLIILVLLLILIAKYLLFSSGQTFSFSKKTTDTITH